VHDIPFVRRCKETIARLGNKVSWRWRQGRPGVNAPTGWAGKNFRVGAGL